MPVRFEIDVERSSARFGASLFDGENLGVLQSSVGVCSRTNHIAVSIGDDSADVRTGRGQPDALAGQVQCAVKMLLV